ncbi:LysR family transcriptional regulator [Stenotrophobium rhamnosiphilum]|uniref:LysR family transcriptional regulator n=1 Tax=Stenotrophobium rhamnosiphilum TaxID=2029166 RepID=A0A2T5MC68_9GAMM|nr:LysR family transcriptional regulator [Stenotrophobium rhamnosiphilum]PTU30173.1 LysR family transcriptional regulator [Stenotrophobium rhamnosiphilum]
MNLNHLSIFHAVASCKSISGGAQRLHISQSAVSKQLGEFERTLGVTLFDRLPRGVRITEAGKLLQGYANRLFALEAEAEEAIGDLQKHIRGRITIGASRTIGGYLLPAILANYRQQYPGVELSLQVENSNTIENRLIAGEIDIGFAEGIVGSDLLEYHVFANDELVLIAAPKHPITKHSPVPLATMMQYPILMHEVGSGTRAVTERAFATKKLTLRPSMTLASTEALKQTVATGAGIAVLSAFAIKTEVAAKTLAVVPIKGLSIQRPLYRVQLKSSWASPALTAFVGLLPK